MKKVNMTEGSGISWLGDQFTIGAEAFFPVGVPHPSGYFFAHLYSDDVGDFQAVEFGPGVCSFRPPKKKQGFWVRLFHRNPPISDSLFRVHIVGSEDNPPGANAAITIPVKATLEPHTVPVVRRLEDDTLLPPWVWHQPGRILLVEFQWATSGGSSNMEMGLVGRVLR